MTDGDETTACEESVVVVGEVTGKLSGFMASGANVGLPGRGRYRRGRDLLEEAAAASAVVTEPVSDVIEGDGGEDEEACGGEPLCIRYVIDLVMQSR